jgi:hypothetical protein
MGKCQRVAAPAQQAVMFRTVWRKTKRWIYSIRAARTLYIETRCIKGRLAGMSPPVPPAGPSFVWNWTSIVSFLAGAAVSVFAEPVRRFLLRPSLEVTFDADTCVLHTETLVAHPSAVLNGEPTFVYLPSEGMYLRVRVGSGGKIAHVVKGCRPYLIGVEIEKEGEFQKSVFVDSLRLKWASQASEDMVKALDIPADVAQFADVISSGKDNPGSYNLQSATLVPFYCQSLFNEEHKKLRPTILVTSDDAKSKSICIVFNWKGAWDTFDAYQD